MRGARAWMHTVSFVACKQRRELMFNEVGEEPLFSYLVRRRMLSKLQSAAPARHRSRASMDRGMALIVSEVERESLALRGRW